MEKLKLMIISTATVCIILIGCGRSEIAKNSKTEIETSDENTTITAEGASVRFENDTELQSSIQGLSVKDI